MIKRFDEIKAGDLSLVGGKGLSLARMTQHKLPIPAGFVVTTEAFDKYSAEGMDDNFKEHLERVFSELGANYVSTRSSAVAEDSSSASWAGQLETYLNVEKSNLAENVEKCWASIKSPRVRQYAKRQKLSQGDLKVAVVVQTMVESDVSGVMFTVNPLNGNEKEMMVEASYGLGEMVVSAEITPDNFVVDKETKKIAATINRKDKMLIFKDGENQVVAVPAAKQDQSSITNENVLELVKLGQEIQDYYGSPQDIEWALSKNSIFILQARPITTLTKLGKEASNVFDEEDSLTAGIGASHGVGVGKARVIENLSQLKDVHDGEILVTHKTTPDYVEAFSRVTAVVTESGGVTSHAAIVSREMGIPAVVGTGDALSRIKTGDIITVDGSAGYVYAGEVKVKEAGEAVLEMPEPSGDDIADMVAAITSGVNEANELWPLAPGQLMPYIDADQSVDMYQKLGQLFKQGWGEKRVAELFERPMFIKMFLLNTGIIGIKSANVYEKRANLKQQVEFVTWLLKLAKILNHNDPQYVVGRNLFWNDTEVSDHKKATSWQSIDEASRRAVNDLSVSLIALNWSLYWDYFPETGHEMHGAYEVEGFGDKARLIVKDYFNLSPTEIWELADKSPLTTLRLSQIYDTNQMYQTFGNRLIGQSLSKHNTHFSLEVDGQPITDPSKINQLSRDIKAFADKQTKYVNSLQPMELVRKGAKISYFARKKFYSHFGKDWFPEDMVEATIKAVGTRFIDENSEAVARSSEEKAKMWDPRNDWLP